MCSMYYRDMFECGIGLGLCMVTVGVIVSLIPRQNRNYKINVTTIGHLRFQGLEN